METHRSICDDAVYRRRINPHLLLGSVLGGAGEGRRAHVNNKFVVNINTINDTPFEMEQLHDIFFSYTKHG